MKKYLFLIFCCVSIPFFAQEASPVGKEAEDTQAEKAVKPRPRPRRPQTQTVMMERLRENAALLLKRYDSDGDGKLNDEEKAALEKEMQLVEELFPLSVAYRRLKIVDKDGDFVISDEEAASVDMDTLREQGGFRSQRGGQGGRGGQRGGQNRQGRGNRN